MRPPGLGGTSVMFADQIPAATVQPQQRRHFQQQQLQNGHGGRRVQIVDSFYPAPPSYPGQHQPAHTNQGEPPPGQAAYQQQQQQMPPTGPGSPPPARQCQCCPFGFHIDLGFVKFAEDVAAGKEQIQNWSSPDKKRARRLMASPSSDRTQMDMSGSDLANISSSFPNDSSLMSKSLDIDDLPELSAEHHQHHHSHGTPGSLACSNGNANHRPRAPSVPASSSQYGPSPQGILKNAGDWQQHQGHVWPTARTAPISNGSGRGGGQQQPGPALFHPQRHVPRHYMPQMQHQSRFYEAHVQQQQQQHRRRHPLSVPAEQPALVGSPTPAYLGSPLMASTPRGAVNDELQPMLAMQHHQQHHHHQHSRPLQISTGQLVSNGRPAMNGAASSTTTTTTSAPSSPVPRAAARTSASANYQSSIAQSMAQLRRSPQKAMATMTFSSKPQAHTSLSALSTMARSAFMPNAPAITARRHYLESGGSRRVLSPEPHLPMGDGAVRSSNLQNRAFFHQNQSASAPGTAIRVPYRSRGAGSAPHIGPSFGTSTLELADFASVRRRRLNADIGGHAQLHSAHLVRSLSPPMHLPLGSAFSSSSPSSAGSLPRWPSGHVQQQQRENCAHSLATLPEPEVSELYDEGTLKADKSKRRKKQLAQNGGECQEPVPKKNFGTQTPPRAAGKEIGICTEGLMPKRGPPTPPPPMAPAKGRAEFSEIGTSPDPALAQQQQPIYVVVASSSPAEELPFAGLVQFASIAVDTRDLAQEEGEGEKRRGPPAPPPKPSGPEVEAELRRRRQQELMGSLVAEFQYCLGHEPEHHPDHEPTLLPKARKFADAQLQVHLRPETIERGVDAHWATKSATIGTSTSDLAKPAPVKVDVSIGTSAAPKMAEIGTATETERPKQLWAIAVQTDIADDEPPDQVEAREGSHPLLLLLDAETQTDGGWLETEIGRRLAETEAERKEKRKRHSVERGTETDEEEPPDQFIMITCNKCEQRSSVASDELFEKILGTEEAAGEESKQQQLEECVELHAEQAPMLLLETVKEEPEFLTGREEEGVTIPDLSGGIARNELGESAKYTEPINELIRSLEFESMEMWRLVHIAVDDCTEEQKAQMLPKAEAVPTLLFVDGPVLRVEKEEKRPEITQAPAITVCTPEMAEKSATTLPSSQMDRLLQGGTGAVHGQAYKLKEQSTSPDEGLVLAEEEFDYAQEQEDMDLETEVDRVSIETDVQTVICVEPSMAAGRSSSSASGSKTPTTPTPNGEEASPSLLTPSLLSARTEALRKLLTEPPRQKPFQRDVDSNRSYRSDRSKALDLDYIADRHKSRGDQQQQQESEPSTPCSSTQTKKALRETISLKKAGGPSTSSAPLASHSNATFPPDPIPARIPRPKIARYSPRDVLAETPDEEEEAADRLTPLRSEMRSLSAWAGGSPSSSPRLSQRALIFRTQIGGPLEEEDEEEEDEDLLAEVEGAISSSSSNNREQLPQDTPDDASSTSSESARTYELSEEDAGDFELSAPLRDALETINDFLLMGSKTPTTNAENEQQSNQIEWAHKYAQHEWLKMATRKNASAELVEQFIDSLESHSTQLMDTVINMTDQNGNTALHYAVSNENFDVVSVLLDSKVCRVDQMNKAGYSALMLGALCELRNETECAIMQRLFQMGNVNAKAVKHAQTALMLAASHGRVESTNLLLKCGADVNIQDVDGSTALMCAAEHGQKEIVKTLLKQPNIDASLTDCDSQTALSIAVENQHRDIGVLIYAHLNFSRLAETSGDNSVSI